MVQQTIRRYLLLQLVFQLGIGFHAATYVIFLLSNGLNLFEANLVNAVFFAVVILFEVPTGAIADVFGRKVSFVSANFLFGIAMLMYAASTTFLGFALAEAVAAVGATLASGAFQAWLVDKLKYHGFDGDLAPIFAKEQYVTTGAMIAGALMGAHIANTNLALPWVVGGVIAILAGLLAALLMHEEYFEKKQMIFSQSILLLCDTVQKSVRYGRTDYAVRFMLIISTIQFFAVMAPNMQWQPLFRQYLDQNSGLGYVWTTMAFALMAGAALAPWFLKRMGSERKTLLLLQVGIGVGILTAPHFGFPVALTVFLMHEIGRGAFSVVKNAYLHKSITSSSERATIVSFESMSHHIGGVLGLVASGALAHYVSIQTAWTIMGSILAVSAFLFWRNGKT